jgi:sugar phosphate isomerase/epimerase
MVLSLSTMWAQQKRFFDDMHAFVHEATRLGYDAIEIAHSLPHEQFERLLAYKGGLPISSIHAPAPLIVKGDVRNSSLNLAALDDEERNEAVRFTKASIDHTKEAGGTHVVVHLGGVGNKMFDAELQLRRMYDSGTKEGERVEELRAECHKLRAEQAAPWVEKARVTLRELADYAGERGIALGIENRLHYHEIPLPDEGAMLFAEYQLDAVGYWHDVGHAEVQDRLGLVDKRLWLDTNGKRCIGSHLHDVTGLADHRAPGKGDVDWTYIRDGLPAEAMRVFEINQGQAAEDVAAGIPFLHERGVIA